MKSGKEIRKERIKVCELELNAKKRLEGKENSV